MDIGNDQNERLKGSLYGALSFTFWGIVPLYWKFVQHISSLELLLHRVFWGVLTILALFLFNKNLKDKLVLFVTDKRRQKQFFLILLSSVLIGLNWFTYVYAVNTNHIIEASFGYFVNPIFNIFIGRIFFKEEIKGLKIIAVLFTMIAICTLFYFWDLQSLWISFLLLFTFGSYGALKKYLKLDSLITLFFEMLIVLLCLLGWFLFTANNIAFIDSTLKIKLYLVLAGPVTIIPLLLFNLGVARTKLSTIGMLQYIAPTLQFLIGVFIYSEVMNVQRLAPFVLIWLAICLYLWEDYKRYE